MNKGRSIISLIIIILILIALGFMLYEIFYIDIFGIMDNNTQVQTISEISNRIVVQNYAKEEMSQNVEIVEPIIDNNLR